MPSAHVIYVLSVWIHLLAAIVWIGGMAFLVLVLAPALRRMEPRDVAVQLIREAGTRFRTVGWICLGVLVLTGLQNLKSRGITWEIAATRVFWSAGFGHVLAMKLGLILAILATSAVHDFRIGPGASTALARDPASPEARRLRAMAMWFGRVNFVLALLVVLLGVALVRGWPF